MKILLSVLTFFILTVSSYSDCMVGTGGVIEDKVYLPDITSLIINVPMNIVLTPSISESILVKTNEDILKNLIFNYDDGELVINGRQDLCPNNLTIFISLKKINSIILNKNIKLTSTGTFKTEDFEMEVNGSADIDFAIEAEDIDLNIDGNGKINLKGSAEELTISMDGSGSLDAGQLVSDEVNVELDGNGVVTVHPRNSLKANLDGNGKIYYKNKPKEISIEKDGNGIIEQIK
ncbi:MAG: hypothetical protein CVV25_05850 [Ignavibacteriae bacterium HGW-Ignavibacteriae-4]|nr:MAG: hypothetical protein CVV25_05850 [Ignavibacteriae bacterium HGW-Ignavibacteriae-4]